MERATATTTEGYERVYQYAIQQLRVRPRANGLAFAHTNTVNNREAPRWLELSWEAVFMMGQRIERALEEDRSQGYEMWVDRWQAPDGEMIAQREDRSLILGRGDTIINPLDEQLTLLMRDLGSLMDGAPISSLPEHCWPQGLVLPVEQVGLGDRLFAPRMS